MYYFSIVTLHIVFAGIWLLNFVAEPVLRKQIIINKNKSGERKFINLYLLFLNLFGIIGSMGILLTGISLVVTSGFFGFFQFTANHWLTTKQILLVAILVIIGAVIIPTAKKFALQLVKIWKAMNQLVMMDTKLLIKFTLLEE